MVTQFLYSYQPVQKIPSWNATGNNKPFQKPSHRKGHVCSELLSLMENCSVYQIKSFLQACTGEYPRCPWRLSNQCERLQKEWLHSESSRRKLYIRGLPAVFTHLPGLHTQLSVAYHRRSDDLRSLRLDYVTLGPGEST